MRLKIKTVLEFTWFEDSEDFDAATLADVKSKIMEMPISYSIDAYLGRREGETYEVAVVEVTEV